ncbi:O-antigen ligase family protein [bacterium]|nr:O-antigen ligase family protein [bacterium]
MQKKIRLENYNVEKAREQELALGPDPVEHGPLPEGGGGGEANDGLFYAFILLGVGSFFLITYPYRDISVPSLVLAVLGFFAILALMTASYLWPQYYLASVAFCIYIPFSGQYPGDFGRMLLGINFTNILIVPVVLQWIMQRERQNVPLFRLYGPDIFLLCFCVLSSISVLRVGIDIGSGSFFDQLVRLKRWLFPFLIYFVFVNIQRNEKALKYIVVAIGATLTTVAILTMKESYDIGPGGSWDRIRVVGVLGSPNGTGAFFVYYTLLFLGLFLCYWRYSGWSWFLLIPFVLCGRAMTLANSRGGLIAFVCAVLATLWFRSKRLFAVGLVFVLLGIQFPEYLPETISGRLFSTIRAENESDASSSFEEGGGLSSRLEASAQGRLRIWRAGVKMVAYKPWFGFGYGQFPFRVGDFDPVVAKRDPHNSYLGIAAEMGVIALLFFVVTLLVILKACLYVYRHASNLFMRALGLAGVGMVLGVMSANFFGSRLDTTELTAYLWILSAIIVQYAHDLRREVRARKGEAPRLEVDPWSEQARESN